MYYGATLAIVVEAEQLVLRIRHGQGDEVVLHLNEQLDLVGPLLRPKQLLLPALELAKRRHTCDTV